METSTGSGQISCTLHLENFWLLWTVGFFLTPTFTDLGLNVLWVCTNANNDCGPDHIRNTCVDDNKTLWMAALWDYSSVSHEFLLHLQMKCSEPDGRHNVRHSALALVSFLNLASSEPRCPAVGLWSAGCVPISPQAQTAPVNAGLCCAVLTQLWDPTGCWAREPRGEESHFHITVLDLLVLWQCVCGWWFGVLVGEGWGHFEG